MTSIWFLTHVQEQEHDTLKSGRSTGQGTGKAYTLPGLDGFSLAVTAAGGRTLPFRYYWAGKQKRMSLGTYPEVPLRQARTLRDEARALLAKGIHPRVHRKQKRTAVWLADESTLRFRWIWVHLTARSGIKPLAARARTRSERYGLPWLPTWTRSRRLPHR